MSRTINTMGGGRVYHTIVNGKIANKVEEGADGAVAREKKNGEVTFEKYSNGIVGKITGARIETKEAGGSKFKELQLDLDNDAMLQIPEYLWKSFVEFSPNIKLLRDVQISVYKSKKGNIGMNVSQEADGQFKNIEPHFTTWEDYQTTRKPTLKNGMPASVYDEDDDSWDYRARDKFIRAELRKFCDQVAFVGEDSVEPEPPFSPDDDDIPF